MAHTSAYNPAPHRSKAFHHLRSNIPPSASPCQPLCARTGRTLARASWRPTETNRLPEVTYLDAHATHLDVSHADWMLAVNTMRTLLLTMPTLFLTMPTLFHTLPTLCLSFTAFFDGAALGTSSAKGPGPTGASRFPSPTVPSSSAFPSSPTHLGPASAANGAYSNGLSSSSPAKLRRAWCCAQWRVNGERDDLTAGFDRFELPKATCGTSGQNSAGAGLQCLDEHRQRQR